MSKNRQGPLKVDQSEKQGVLGLIQDLIRLHRAGERTKEQLLAYNEGRNPFALHWFDAIVRKSQSKLSSKLRQKVIVPQPPTTFTEDLIIKLVASGMDVIYLPSLDIVEGFLPRNWVEPGRWFYVQIGDGKLEGFANRIKGGWYAIDTTPFVDCTDGTQMIPNDPLAPFLTKLRQERKIFQEEEIPYGSRFGISWDEWSEVIAPAFAEKFGLKTKKVRLERAIEFNAFGNIYDANRGKFNSWQWFQDVFDLTNRLFGGYHRHGGLARVDFCSGGKVDARIAGRLLVSF